MYSIDLSEKAPENKYKHGNEEEKNTTAFWLKFKIMHVFYTSKRLFHQ